MGKGKGGNKGGEEKKAAGPQAQGGTKGDKAATAKPEAPAKGGKKGGKK